MVLVERVLAGEEAAVDLVPPRSWSARRRRRRLPRLTLTRSRALLTGNVRFTCLTHGHVSANTILM